MTTYNEHTLHKDHYQAYLVRLWQDNSQAPWRASTQCVQTGERRFFGDLAALCAFLVAQTTAKSTAGNEQ